MAKILNVHSMYGLHEVALVARPVSLYSVGKHASQLCRPTCAGNV